MKGWLAAQKNYIGVFIPISKKRQPVGNSLFRQGRIAMLGGIYITMTAGKITGRENMKKNISFIGLKGQSSNHLRSHYFVQASKVY